VLSGCETGRGRLLDGEGVTGLPYALFVAGNRNAVMTLWKVADAPSARFVSAFFTRIARGERIGRALTATKREFAARSTTAHPLFWAGFVQYGAD
jgi:CHAT domain-containing protein